MIKEMTLDANIPLALSVHANKGVYAVLVGSGISRDAYIPTGWEVVKDLIRRVAILEGKLDDCADDPANWYRDYFTREPDYSELLEMLAKTPPERQQLLRAYFEPTEEEREEGKKVPTDAHHALAELVSSGYVRVIVTTNFDRLTEQAIEGVGIRAAVLSTPDAIRGALPLAHARCTIVKLHGDYLDTRILNTATELERYDEAVDRLLDQILDEYGLIVCGWSGDWDPALRAAIERAPNRRFSTYWAYPRTLTDSARRLINHRGATPISGVTANDFFRKLAEGVKSLEELTAPPPFSAKRAAQTVKRYMSEENSRIRLHDLVMGEVARVRNIIIGPDSLPLYGEFSGEILLNRMRRLEAESAPLMAMFAVAGYWSESGTQDLWIRALERLATVPRPSGQYTIPFESLRRYPALLAAYASGIAAVAAGRLESVADFMLKPSVHNHNLNTREPFVAAVNPSTVLDFQFQRSLPGRERHLTPFSERLWYEVGLHDALRDFLPDEQQYMNTFDYFEYLAGIMGYSLRRWAPAGCFVWRGMADGDARNIDAAVRVTEEVDRLGDNWPPLQAGAFGGSAEQLRETKTAYDATLPSWRW